MNWKQLEISKIARWLYKEKEYGYSLLFIHGAYLGIKITYQLKLKWIDVIENGKVREFLEINDGRNEKRDIEELCYAITQKVYEKVTPNLNDFIYVKKSGKQIISNTLTRELNKIVEDYMNYAKGNDEEYIYTGLMLNEDKLRSERNGNWITSKDFENSWAIEQLEKYNYSKKAFVEISKHMGHKNVQATIQVLGKEPKKFSFIYNSSEIEREDINSVNDFYKLDKKED